MGSGDNWYAPLQPYSVGQRKLTIWSFTLLCVVLSNMVASILVTGHVARLTTRNLPSSSGCSRGVGVGCVRRGILREEFRPIELGKLVPRWRGCVRPDPAKRGH